MNILQVVSSSRTSGAEKHLMVLSQRLRGMGHNVTAVCPPGGWLPDTLKAAGVPTVELAMHGVYAPRAIFSIRTMARSLDIDIIHTHLTRATYMGYFAGSLSRVPVISTVHVWSRDLAYRWLPRRNHWFVAVSEYLREVLLARGVPPPRVHTVYNGTELIGQDGTAPAGELSVRAELGLPADADIVGLVGRVDSFKGHQILVAAARPVVERCPHAYFVCVGRAEPSLQQALWEQACGEGVDDRFRFTGVRNDVNRLLDAMDVVTLPSISEACSMAIIEAMAVGKPVVATRAGGNPELVVDQTTGILVERDKDALADAISTLLANPSRRSAMGQAGRERARSLFTADAMARNIEMFYRRVLDTCRQ